MHLLQVLIKHHESSIIKSHIKSTDNAQLMNMHLIKTLFQDATDELILTELSRYVQS